MLRSLLNSFVRGLVCTVHTLLEIFWQAPQWAGHVLYGCVSHNIASECSAAVGLLQLLKARLSPHLSRLNVGAWHLHKVRIELLALAASALQAAKSSV